ncbi:MAG: hypothetical protein AB1762_11395, partial [Gemmatimonadota bacterium]
ARATDALAAAAATAEWGFRAHDLLSIAPVSARRAERRSQMYVHQLQVGSALSADGRRPAREYILCAHGAPVQKGTTATT